MIRSRLRFATLVAGLVLALSAFASANAQSPAEPGAPEQGVHREPSAFDRFTAVAAVISIGVVGVAGIYVYRMIRKGL
ncbi:MAG: hypothetical protein ACT4OM_09750 [Actinomycetota bacterium]